MGGLFEIFESLRGGTLWDTSEAVPAARLLVISLAELIGPEWFVCELL